MEAARMVAVWMEMEAARMVVVWMEMEAARMVAVWMEMAGAGKAVGMVVAMVMDVAMV